MEKPIARFNDPGSGRMERRLLVILLVVGGAVLGGALLAPPLHSALVAWGRGHPGLVGLRDLPFERVVSRCVLVLLVLGLVPGLRWAGIRRPADMGMPAFRHGGRGGLSYLLAGTAMIATVLFAGWVLGAYRLAGGGDWFQVVAFLPAALLVGIIEETFFRGLLYRSLRTGWGLWAGAVVSSLLFSAVHFATPEPVIGIAHAHWYSGLQLLPDTFRKVHAGYHYFPFMLNLFLMGVVLCLVMERTGNLYAAIGLHAGWIWALRGGNILLLREPDFLPAIFGWGNRLEWGYAATGVMALLVLGLAVSPRRKAPS